MLFLAAKLLWMLCRPSVLPLFLILYGLLRRRWTPVAAGFAAYALVALFPLHVLVLAPLENRIPRATLPPSITGIIVLGGAVDEVITRDRGLPSLNDNAERMTEAVALARLYPEARLVFTGGSGRLPPAEVTEADAAEAFFRRAGVPAAQMLFERASRNTEENAENTQAMLRPALGQTWVLITSAMHMPRALGLLRRLGWQVFPWPVGYKTGHSLRGAYDTSFPERLHLIDAGVHEWIGLLAYRLLRRTDTLLPGP
jgi:uncharacterized SAM-binding protein YcdF (DUF218 family)